MGAKLVAANTPPIVISTDLSFGGGVGGVMEEGFLVGVGGVMEEGFLVGLGVGLVCGRRVGLRVGLLAGRAPQPIQGYAGICFMLFFADFDLPDFLPLPSFLVALL